jgi:hypothetical protein
MFATRGKTVFAVITGVWLVSLNAGAGVTYVASGTNSVTGKALSASVTFDITNSSELVVSLSNLGAPVRAASDILTALYFDLNGVTTLTPVSALLGPGSVLANGPTPSGTTLGDFWEYKGGLSVAPDGDTFGISSTGLNIFGPGGNFGTNSQKLDGGSYGVINGSPSGGNGQIANEPLVDNTIVFTLNGLPAGFSLRSISGVEFQYGTTLTGTPLLTASPVPEPSALAVLGLGTAVLALRRKVARNH